MPERLLSAAACAEIAARANAATMGPWSPEVSDLPVVHLIAGEAIYEGTKIRAYWLADFDAQEKDDDEAAEAENRVNATFCAAAREDIPALLRTVAALRRALGDVLPHAGHENCRHRDDCEVGRAAAVYEATR